MGSKLMKATSGLMDEAAHCSFDPYQILSFDIHVCHSEKEHVSGLSLL